MCSAVNSNQSINQSINQFISLHSTAEARATVRLCRIKEKYVLRQILNVLTDEAVRQFSGREFQVSEQQLRNDERQCPSCAAELTEASVWMIAANETDCMG